MNDYFVSRRKYRKMNYRQRKKFAVRCGGPYDGFWSVKDLIAAEGGTHYQAVPVGEGAAFSGLDAKTTYDAKFVTTDADNGIMHMWLTKR